MTKVREDNDGPEYGNWLRYTIENKYILGICPNHSGKIHTYTINGETVINIPNAFVRLV